MSLSPTDFRNAFPEFSDDSKYTDDAIQMWIDASVNFFNVQRWGSLLTLGTELWVAHQLVLSARDQATMDTGGIPGEMNGAIASKAVDRVSVAYSDANISLKNAGDYGLTTYGTRYLRMARMVGAGAIYIGPRMFSCPAPAASNTSNPADITQLQTEVAQLQTEVAQQQQLLQGVIIQ
jgi:hypothetical protein